MATSLICRVCGMTFTAPRWDARTCSTTCRSRLHRGGDLAYLAGLTAKQQRLERIMHDTRTEWIATYREAAVANREARRARRQQQIEQRNADFLAMAVGRAVIAEQKRRQEQGTLATVAGILQVFVRERRNDMSAEAMANFLALPEQYPVEAIARALDQLRADGDYDRIVSTAGN
jgi:SLT domain-containing protein